MDDIEKLKNTISLDKYDEIEAYEDEISLKIKKEILKRYVHENGSIQGTITQDPLVQEAVKVMNDNLKYNKVSVVFCQRVFVSRGPLT